MTSPLANVGQAPAAAGASERNASTFLFRQMLGKTGTIMLVQVKAVTNHGGLSAVGFVDIQPMVAQMDGAGNTVSHGIILNVPYCRLQGGANAVILDPEPGDIGIAVICSRDISSVKATKKPAPPGSRRRFDMADSVYIGGVLNGVPSQYVQMSTAGIAVTSPVKVTVTAPACDIISNNVNVGGVGGKKVVLDGDPVIGGGGGTVQASSTKVKAV